MSFPTVTFGLLYCVFVVSHERRRVLHLGVTRHPTKLLGGVAVARKPFRTNTGINISSLIMMESSGLK